VFSWEAVSFQLVKFPPFYQPACSLLCLPWPLSQAKQVWYAHSYCVFLWCV
jgi:hypothetical protein